MILITGASGNVGRELVRILMARGVPFRAMVRSPEATQRIEARRGVEIVAGDFNDTATTARALAGVDRAFLLTPSSAQAEAQQSAFVEFARRVGVSHIVKLSQLAAALDSPARFLRYHAAVERTIRSSGLPYTLLRPNLFMQGVPGVSNIDHRASRPCDPPPKADTSWPSRGRSGPRRKAWCSANWGRSPGRTPSGGWPSCSMSPSRVRDAGGGRRAAHLEEGSAALTGAPRALGWRH